MERDLILQAKAGNQDAFSLLCRNYDRRIYNTAYGFLRNVDDAKDLVQEVLLRAYRNLNRFDETRPLFPWLYRITRNLCLNRMRKKDNNSASIVDENQLVAVASLPEEMACAEETTREIRAAIDALPPLYKEILILKHFQECSYAEIADILAIPQGTVMSRLYNGRMKLKHILEERDL